LAHICTICSHAPRAPAMQYSKAMGAETWAISTSASKEAEARRFGASHFLISTVREGWGLPAGCTSRGPRRVAVAVRCQCCPRRTRLQDKAAMAEKKSYFDFLLCCASGACPPCLHHRRIAHVMHPGALSDRRQDGHRRVHEAAEAAHLLLPRRPARRGDPAHGASHTFGGAVRGKGGSLSCCARSRGWLPPPMSAHTPHLQPAAAVQALLHHRRREVHRGQHDRRHPRHGGHAGLLGGAQVLPAGALRRGGRSARASRRHHPTPHRTAPPQVEVIDFERANYGFDRLRENSARYRMVLKIEGFREGKEAAAAGGAGAGSA
jgi:hypothetical protein